MLITRLIFVLLITLFPVLGQLAVEQKEHDFRNLAALYAKRYAPAAWKKQLLGVDILNLGPWIDKVRASKTDLDFLELCFQYVGSLEDAHATFSMTSNFSADSGLFVDIYEGKVLIQAVNTTALPPSRFPIRIGDELLAVDGKPVAELIDEYAKLRGNGNPMTSRRDAANRLTFRPQSVFPRAPEVPAESAFQILHQTGATATYQIPWTKVGIPVTKIGPAPTPEFGKSSTARAARTALAASPAAFDFMQLLPEARDLSVTGMDTSARFADESQQWVGLVTGIGSRFPLFSPLPGMVVRRGLSAADTIFVLTYEVGNRRIGYLRIPSFAPASTAAATAEFASEIAFLQQNTDGLVVDVMRNPGGSCGYLISASTYLYPDTFFAHSAEFRATQSLVIGYEQAVRAAKAANAEAWIINSLEFQLQLMQKAYAENRGMTGPMPLCADRNDIPPARTATGAIAAYTKPLIVLTDEFSFSGADFFPAMIQDNKRGLIVGVRTAGAGGHVVSWPAGFYSETQTRTTESIAHRKTNIQAPGYPSSPYLENVGVHPDLYLNFMTKDNLLTGGRQFVLDFTGAIMTEINRPR